MIECAAPVGLPHSGLGHRLCEVPRFCLPAPICGASAARRARPSVDQSADRRGQHGTRGARRDVVCGAHLVVVIGDNGAREGAGLTVGAATKHVAPGGLRLFVLALAREAFIEVCGVRVAPTGNGDVQL